MPTLTYDQLRMLNSYSVFTENTDKPLFTLENLHKDFFIKDFRNLMMGITQAGTEADYSYNFLRS